MIVIPSRRAVLVAGASTILALSDGGNSHQYDVSPSSLSDLICNYTPRAFRAAVAATGTFLYRGENDIYPPMILAPKPDLLLPGTYDDPTALAYFQCLEKRLLAAHIDARPSLGHIATSDKSEAAQWGDAVTIWPMGESLSYVWPRREKVFFPAPTQCPSDELAINRDLEVALKQGHEVLFYSEFAKGTMLPKEFPGATSAFLAVPARFESSLFDLIKKPEFASQS